MAKSVRRNEIWMVQFNSETNGLTRGYRPAIVVSNDFANTNRDCMITTVVPLTSSTIKGGLPTHVRIKANDKTNKLNGDSIALTEQLITVNRENDIRFCLGKLTDEEVVELNKALMISVGIFM